MSACVETARHLIDAQFPKRPNWFPHIASAHRLTETPKHRPPPSVLCIQCCFLFFGPQAVVCGPRPHLLLKHPKRTAPVLAAS